MDEHRGGSPVSIPLRKVSRSRHPPPWERSSRGFHPSKEGFKAGVQRRLQVHDHGFHPSKEGFKVVDETSPLVVLHWFPSL